MEAHAGRRDGLPAHSSGDYTNLFPLHRRRRLTTERAGRRRHRPCNRNPVATRPLPLLQLARTPARVLPSVVSQLSRVQFTFCSVSSRFLKMSGDSGMSMDVSWGLLSDQTMVSTVKSVVKCET